MTMYVAGLQLDIVWEDKKANHAKVRDLVGAANLPKGALLALPEMFATGFSMNVAEIAQTDARETETFLGALAKQHGIFVCGGVVV
ncbi:MAG: carbon-nitrogen family hydrolase, partial [Planctomycetota bacterium]